MSAFYRVLVLIIGIIWAGNLGSVAQPQVVPKYLPVHVGTASRFNCTAVQNDPVYWTTKPYGSTSTHDIYIGEQYLVDDYGRSGRFSVEVNSTTRRYDLVISAIMQTDAGVYICIDGRGFGKKTYAELVVYGQPICREESPMEYYMGENVFDLSPDVMRFSCRMNYSGNLRPRFEWSVGGKTFEGARGSESEMESSSLELVARSMFSNAVLTWKAVFQQGLHDVDRTRILWTSDPFRIHYTKWTNKAVKECKGILWNLDCNPPCSYALESSGNGTQYCLANYSTGNGFHLIPSCISAVGSSDTAGVSKDPLAAIITLGVMCTVFALCVVILAVCLYKRKPSTPRSITRTEEEPYDAIEMNYRVANRPRPNGIAGEAEADEIDPLIRNVPSTSEARLSTQRVSRSEQISSADCAEVNYTTSAPERNQNSHEFSSPAATKSNSTSENTSENESNQNPAEIDLNQSPAEIEVNSTSKNTVTS